MCQTPMTFCERFEKKFYEALDEPNRKNIVSLKTIYDEAVAWYHAQVKDAKKQAPCVRCAVREVL